MSFVSAFKIVFEEAPDNKLRAIIFEPDENDRMQILDIIEGPKTKRGQKFIRKMINERIMPDVVLETKKSKKDVSNVNHP